MRRFCTVSFSRRAANPLMKGVYIVPTPIGNLQDITERSLDILRNVNVIAAEDTRHTAKLLAHFGILNKTVWSYYSHNSYEQTPKLVKLAKSGEIIALVSDAGTPGICDPGAKLVAACVKENIPVHPVPGPSALTAALSICGFEVSQFTFLGFLPVKGSARASALETLSSTLHVVAFFEAPHRILKTMTEFNELGAGERLCVCCREISKVHEEIWRGTVREAIDWLCGGEHRIRGEFTVLLGPWVPKMPTKEQAKKRISSDLEKLEADGISRSEAVSIVSERNTCGLNGEWEFKRSEVYKIALKMDWNVK